MISAIDKFSVAKYIDAALGGHFWKPVSCLISVLDGKSSRTKYLVANIMLLDEITQQLFIHSGSIDDLTHITSAENANMSEHRRGFQNTYRSIPERATQLKGLEENWLCLLH